MPTPTPHLKQKPKSPRLLLAAFEAMEPRTLLAAIGYTPIFSHSSAQSAPASANLPAPASLTSINLHSNPGASHVIYLDFNGHTTTGTIWNSQSTGGAAIVTPAFSTDSDYTTFSVSEASIIQEVWAWVSEDYAPFDVDVTTQDPGVSALSKSNSSDTTYGIRIVIGGSSLDWLETGTATAAGVGFLNSFTLSTDTPVFVFQAQTHNSAFEIAAAASHEAGHSLNLNHDGTLSPPLEYYSGQGIWSPIMGAAYTKLNQWSKGEYASASNTEDDLAVITSHGLSYRPDEAGNTRANAASLNITSSTTASASGIITTASDVDFYQFSVGATGNTSIQINPAATGPNLDILANLYDSTGALLATSNPLGAFNASFSLTLNPGTYYVSIDGTGEGNPLISGYSDYGSLGQYTLDLTLSTFDVTAPTITSLSTVSSPTTSSVASFDVTFSEPVNPTSFTFADLSLTLNGGANLINSFSGISILPLSENTYRISGLTALTTPSGDYVFSVNPQGISDLAGNTGTDSPSSSAWTHDAIAPTLTAIQAVTSPTSNPVTSLAVTFSEPINLATFTFADLSLTLNGGANLITAASGISIAAFSGSTYIVTGLGPLNTADGTYAFKVNPAQLTDIAGNAGASTSLSATWTLDSTPPAILSITPVSTPRNTSISTLDIVFSESVDLATFTFADLSLTLNGGANLLTSANSITQVTPTTYRVSGFASLTATPGDYTFTASAANIADAQGNSGSPSQSSITWTRLSTAPTLKSAIGALIANEDQPPAPITLTSVFTDPYQDPATLLFSVQSNSNPGLLSLTITGSLLNFTLTPDAVGTATVTLIAANEDGLTVSDTFTLTVTPINDAPTINVSNPPAVNEDAPTQTLTNWASFNPGPANESAQTLVGYTISNISDPSFFAVPPAIDETGTLTYTLAANAFGSVTFQLQTADSGGTANGGVDTSTPQTFTITVLPVNDAPTFTASNPPTANEDAGPQSLTNWAAFNPGSANESTQTASYTVLNISNPSLFSSAPAIAPDGTLTYTPALNASGTSTFTVQVKDSGGASSPSGHDVDTSASKTFTITITSVNDAPSINVTDPAPVTEDSSQATLPNWASFIPGPSNESSQTSLGYTVSSVSNPALFSAPPSVSANGTLTYTPAPNASGTATFKLQVKDSGGTPNGGPGGDVDTSPFYTLTITVIPVNDAPSLSAANPPAINEDAGPQILPNWATLLPGDPNESAQTALAYTVTSLSNPSLFSTAPAVDIHGTLTYTPAPNASGTATFKLQVKDSGGTSNGGSDTSAFQTFTITINPVNDAPSFTAVNPPAVNEDAGKQTLTDWALFSPGPVGQSDESAQTSLGYTITSISNPALFASAPTLSIDGTLTYTPAPNASGTSTFKVQVKDSGGTSNGGSDTSAFHFFTITVIPTNDAPAIGSVSLATTGIETTRITASNVTDIDSSVSAVAFYHDINKNGLPDLSELLGQGKSSAIPGLWTLDIYTPTAPIGVSSILAVATDATGLTSPIVSALLTLSRTLESTKAIQYIDINGNTVKASITGGGVIKAYFDSNGNANPFKFTVDGSSSAKSSLTFTITKAKGSSTDQTSIGDIIISGGLASFSAPKLNLTGSLTSSAVIKSLTLNDVSDSSQQSISLGGTASDKSTLTFGRLSNVTLSSTATLAAFKALDWQDTDANPDALTAPGLTSLTLSGRTALGFTKLDGDMQASINLTTAAVIGAKTAPTVSISIAGSAQGDWNLRAYKLTTAAIKGSVSDSLWSSDGGFGSITITGSAIGLTLDTTADVTSFKAGHVESTALKISGSLGSLSALDFLGGSISAAKTGAITTTGRLAAKLGTALIPAIAGDFSAKLTVTGKSVASISIAGALTDTSLSITGNLGPVTVGSARNLTLNTTGDIASFTSKGQTQDTTLTSQGAIGPITSLNWLGGSITADKLGALTTKGLAATKTATAIAGTFTAGLTLTGQGVAATALTLASASIAGDLTGSHWSIQGKSGAITVGSASNTQITTLGAIASYTSKGQTQDTTLTSQGNIGTISSLNWLQGSISADAISSVTTKGLASTQTTPAIPGDFSGLVTVTGEGVTSKANALGSVTIAGTLLNSAWSITGNTGLVSVGAANNSSFFVGVSTLVDPTTLPTAKSQFSLPTATLQGFTVTGKAVANPNTTPTFTNTRIAAGTLTNVTLKLVDASQTLPNGFVAAAKITAYARQTGLKPTDLFKVANKTTPALYDSILPADSYRLQIVS